MNAGASGGVPSKPRRVFAGLPGAIHPDSGAEDKGRWAGTDPESFLRENLSLTDLVSLAYMFNFSSESVVLSLGERKASVQVGGIVRNAMENDLGIFQYISVVLCRNTCHLKSKMMRQSECGGKNKGYLMLVAVARGLEMVVFKSSF